MPIYEYKCSSCGKRSEFIQKYDDDPRTDCKLCGSKNSLVRLVSAPAIQFKGSGWYITDYAKKSSTPATTSSVDSSASSVTDSATDTASA